MSVSTASRSFCNELIYCFGHGLGSSFSFGQRTNSRSLNTAAIYFPSSNLTHRSIYRFFYGREVFQFCYLKNDPLTLSTARPCSSTGGPECAGVPSCLGCLYATRFLEAGKVRQVSNDADPWGDSPPLLPVHMCTAMHYYRVQCKDNTSTPGSE
jgi:hypothetical protein